MLSDLWAAPPAAEQPVIVIAAEVVEQITHSFQFLAFLLIGLAFVSFGWVLLTRPGVPKGYGWVSVVQGLVAFLGDDITLTLGGFLGTPALFLLLGWKVYSLSRAA